MINKNIRLKTMIDGQSSQDIMELYNKIKYEIKFHNLQPYYIVLFKSFVKKMIDAQNEKNRFGERKWVTPHEFLSIIHIINNEYKTEIAPLQKKKKKKTEQEGPYGFKLIQDYGKIF